MVIFLGFVGILLWVLSAALGAVYVGEKKDYKKKRRECAFYLFFLVAPSFLILAAFLYLIVGM